MYAHVGKHFYTQNKSNTLKAITCLFILRWVILKQMFTALTWRDICQPYSFRGNEVYRQGCRRPKSLTGSMRLEPGLIPHRSGLTGPTYKMEHPRLAALSTVHVHPVMTDSGQCSTNTYQTMGETMTTPKPSAGVSGKGVWKARG